MRGTESPVSRPGESVWIASSWAKPEDQIPRGGTGENTEVFLLNEIFVPRDEAHWHSLRLNDVTSTEVAALFHCSPHLREFELYYRKKNQLLVEFDPNERTIWGTRLQDAIGRGIAEDQKWKIRPMTEYIRHADRKLGASFDFGIEEPFVGVLETKNVDALIFRDGWIVEESEVEAPPHIELQVQTQLAVSEREKAYIGALVGGNRVVLLERKPDPSVISAIYERVDAFWERILRSDPPEPNWVKDAAFISSLYQDVAEGKVLDLRSDRDFAKLALQYRAAQENEKHAGLLKQALKAEILTKIEDAEKVVGDGFSISAGTVKGGHVEYERNAYRAFKVNWRKS